MGFGARPGGRACSARCVNPSLAHFQLLRRLRQQLRHRDGIGVVYLFSDHELANQWLVQEIDAHLRARTQRLTVLGAAAPTDAVATVLSPVFSESAGGVGAVIWLALTEPAHEWDSLRAQVLARLNENRATLARSRAFMVLVFPSAFEARAPSIAPDLWSVRAASHHVPPWLPETDGNRSGISLALPALAVSANGTSGDDAQTPEELRWASQWQVWNPDRQQVLSPLWAWQLVDQWLERGRPKRAKEFADQALAISRRAVDITQDAPQSLRDLSVSLDNVGDVARDLGQLDEARTCFTQALLLVKRLRQVLASDNTLEGIENDLLAKLGAIGSIAA